MMGYDAVDDTKKKKDQVSGAQGEKRAAVLLRSADQTTVALLGAPRGIILVRW